MPRGVPRDPRRTAGRHYRAEIERWTAQHYPELIGRGARAWQRARGETSRDADFRHWYGVLQAERRKGDAVDRSPTGRLAQALVEFGYRPANAWWPVGETDRFR